jgi:hypothetical protein
MGLRTSATAEVAGTKQEFPLPPIHIVVDVDPQSVSGDGELHYAWRVSSAVVTADAQTAPEIAQGMRAEVAAVQHLAGSATVTSRGLCADLAVDPSTVLDAGATGQMVEQVAQSLRDVAVPLPDEEVGRGARWQKISQLDASSARGSRLTQTDTFTLVDVQADHGTVDDVLAQSAPPQPLRAPGVSQARVESLLASGQARSLFDLARLVPQTKFEGTTTMVVSGQSPGETSRRGTMVMRLGFEIQGRPR